MYNTIEHQCQQLCLLCYLIVPALPQALCSSHSGFQHLSFITSAIGSLHSLFFTENTLLTSVYYTYLLSPSLLSFVLFIIRSQLRHLFLKRSFLQIIAPSLSIPSVPHYCEFNSGLCHRDSLPSLVKILTLHLTYNYLVISRRVGKVSQVVKNPLANAEDAGDMGSIPGSGRSPGE